jgi:hypothetical protein
MINLICFPHYTAGGLLCDILSGTFSPIAPNGGINSLAHQVGKIGDSDTVLDNYNSQEFLSKLAELNVTGDSCIGTHCWPGALNISQLNQLVTRTIVITTTTYRSKLYRWIRAYYHYYEKSDPWLSVLGSERIDKERETAKNYIKPFLPVHGEHIINIEFAEIVENSQQFQNLIEDYNIGNHIVRWREINYFLYEKEIWNSAAVRRFYEAELETCLDQYYIYE